MNRLEIEMHRRQNTHCKESKILLHRISNRQEKSRKHQAVKGEKSERDEKKQHESNVDVDEKYDERKKYFFAIISP